MAGSGAPEGNRNAVKAKPWREALDRAIKRDDMKPKDQRRLLDMAADALLNDAATGDINAIKELGNRLDGKAPQSVEIEAIGSFAEVLRAARERSGTT